MPSGAKLVSTWEGLLFLGFRQCGRCAGQQTLSHMNGEADVIEYLIETVLGFVGFDRFFGFSGLWGSGGIMKPGGEGRHLAEAWRLLRIGGSDVVPFGVVGEAKECSTGASRPPRWKVGSFDFILNFGGGSAWASQVEKHVVLISERPEERASETMFGKQLKQCLVLSVISKLM